MVLALFRGCRDSTSKKRNTCSMQFTPTQFIFLLIFKKFFQVRKICLLLPFISAIRKISAQLWKKRNFFTGFHEKYRPYLVLLGFQTISMSVSSSFVSASVTRKMNSFVLFFDVNCTTKNTEEIWEGYEKKHKILDRKQRHA